MKRLAKNLLLAGSVFATGAVAANGLDGITPYVGMDGKWQLTRGKGEWKKIVRKEYGGGTVYLGTKYCDRFGLELGFSQTFKRRKTHPFASGEDFFENGDTGGAVMRVSNKFTTLHVDVNGYIPVTNCWEFIGSVGFGWVKPQVKVRVPVIAGPGINSLLFTTPGFFPQDAAALTTLHGRYRMALRLGAGLQLMVNKCFGVRSIVRWEGTSAVRLHGNFEGANRLSILNFDPTRHMFRDTVSVALGVFWNFN